MKNTIRTVLKGLPSLFLTILLFGTMVSGQNQAVNFESDSWELAPGARIVDYLGRKALTGSADLKGIEFENGVVEVDIAFTGGRNFPGIVFRKQNAANYEEFYVRPHKSGQPDALQYTPVINGQSGWQLYYGEGFTGTRTFPTKKWVHFKLEVSGTQARVFIGNSKSPAMNIRYLKHGSSRGGLGLKVTGPAGLAYFTNFQFRHDNNLTFEAPPEIEIPLGMITDWENSQTFSFNQIDTKEYPSRELLSRVKWQALRSEATGVVNLARNLKRGPVVPAVALARTKIVSGREKSMPIEFGYSDLVSIFLNGRLLYSGRSVFRQRDPFFQGYVGLFDTIYLPLKKGDNELMFILTESVGGWGFICRSCDAVFRHTNLTEVWELSHQLSYPETVAYDRKRDVLYVSNLYSDGSQFISKLSPEGEILDKEWVSGLAQPTGMAVGQDTLYVVERSGLAEIDIPSGEIRQKHPAPSPGFLNDIAMDHNGDIYISDGQRARILKFSNGEFSDWRTGRELAAVNGLHYFSGKLYIGTSADSSVKVIDLKDPAADFRTLAHLDQGAVVDGLETDREGNVLVSNFNGKVYRITPDGEKTLLLDTTAPKNFCANFAYIPDKGLLIIPSLTDNRITAYQLKNF